MHYFVNMQYTHIPELLLLHIFCTNQVIYVNSQCTVMLIMYVTSCIYYYFIIIFILLLSACLFPALLQRVKLPVKSHLTSPLYFKHIEFVPHVEIIGDRKISFCSNNKLDGV